MYLVKTQRININYHTQVVFVRIVHCQFLVFILPFHNIFCQVIENSLVPDPLAPSCPVPGVPSDLFRPRICSGSAAGTNPLLHRRCRVIREPGTTAREGLVRG